MDFKLIRTLPGTLWSPVAMEFFERLAYSGMAMFLGIYVVDRLGVPADTYGRVYTILTATLFFLPVLTLYGLFINPDQARKTEVDA